jgi:CheY-like chemotaxis protein
MNLSTPDVCQSVAGHLHLDRSSTSRCSLVHFPLRCLVRASWGCSLWLSAHFLAPTVRADQTGGRSALWRAITRKAVNESSRWADCGMRRTRTRHPAPPSRVVPVPAGARNGQDRRRARAGADRGRPHVVPDVRAPAAGRGGIRRRGRGRRRRQRPQRGRRVVADVVLLDVQLPDGDGFRVTLELAAHEPPPAVVLDARSGCASKQRQPAHQPAEDQVEQAMRYPRDHAPQPIAAGHRPGPTFGTPRGCGAGRGS